MLDPEAPFGRSNMGPAEFCILDTVRDKTAAKFGLWPGARVQSVVTRKAVRANGKTTSARRVPVTPWSRNDRGIHRDDLRIILAVRLAYGGKKGARAMRRLATLRRERLADARFLRAET